MFILCSLMIQLLVDFNTGNFGADDFNPFHIETILGL
jgi:hypothetical protein